MNIIGHIKKLDLILFFSALGLSIMGLISIYSACISSGDFSDVYRQAIFIFIGVLAMILFSFFDNRNIRENPAIILSLYFLSIILDILEIPTLNLLDINSDIVLTLLLPK
jgi:cell division protein FtsW (lipid II flippase)